MKARKKSPKPIGKIFGCRNGKLNIHNIERKAPTGELTSVDIHDGLSGSDRVHYIVTNLVLFLILYYCLHWCWCKLGQIEVLIYFIPHQQCFSHLDVALWWKQRHKWKSKRLPLETKNTQKNENWRLGFLKSLQSQQCNLRGCIRCAGNDVYNRPE